MWIHVHNLIRCQFKKWVAVHGFFCAVLDFVMPACYCQATRHSRNILCAAMAGEEGDKRCFFTSFQFGIHAIVKKEGSLGLAFLSRLWYRNKIKIYQGLYLSVFVSYLSTSQFKLSCSGHRFTRTKLVIRLFAWWDARLLKEKDLMSAERKGGDKGLGSCSRSFASVKEFKS